MSEWLEMRSIGLEWQFSLCGIVGPCSADVGCGAFEKSTIYNTGTEEPQQHRATEQTYGTVGQVLSET